MSPAPVIGALVVDTLGPEHAGEALTVQYAAYLSEGRRYGTTEIPPLVETPDELAADLRRLDVVGFAAWLGPRLVGSVRLRGVGGDGPVAFVRYSVAPDVQGRGIGTALIDAAHAVLPGGTASWLVTGVDSAENLALYRRRGYAERGREVDAGGVAVVRMERIAP
ncbi:MAG TPA: GNAT family N-acetyltransferase [Actinomycetospora sp.]|uniref:GNAT family N-acetyltransferase n=1 Tax=Actinomycetospora sp. TaxID=1872135 RepID=UPI002F42A0FE